MSDLSFLAPLRLWLLVVPLALLVLYLVVQRLRRGYAVRFTNLDLLDKVAPDRPGWRRHLPAALLLFGLVVGTVAMARPAVAQEKATKGSTVVLAMDVSLSMEATDVSPSRVAAAKDAAGSFLKNLPDGVKVGVVAFDGSASTAIEPTDNKAAVQRTIDRLRLGEGTAIGEAVFAGLDEISAANQNADGKSTTDGKGAPGAIVLMSDGETTQGRPNDEAAQAAKKAGVPVSTIAFGTDAGTVTAPDGSTVNVPVNASALADLANGTGGRALTAATAEQLQKVYSDLAKSVKTEKVTREITDWFTIAAMAFVVLAAAGSLLWFSRLP
jgi:Ca-activated chloride channel homolog